MDVASKVDLVTRNTLEVITREDAERIFQTNSSPKGYIGVEPSGLFHLGWMIWTQKFKDLMEAGVRMTLLEATWHAWINDKFGGDMTMILSGASYIEHCLRALGIDLTQVKLLKAEQLVDHREYWESLIRISKSLSLSRIKRAVTIMGRKEEETAVDFSKLIYPCMQVEDIFYLDLDFCLGGIDQRRAHVLAREVAETYGYKKPVAVHTPLLSGLQGANRMDMATDAEQAIMDKKMSKSKPETCIFIHDSPESIRTKLNVAYCPPRESEGNPVLDIARYILINDQGFIIRRPAKYGGDATFANTPELISAYQQGIIHPLDLKNAVADSLAMMLTPVREYFSQNSEARQLLDKLPGSCPK